MRPICSSCDWFRGRHTDPEQLAAAERSGVGLPRGHCQRFPEVVPKHDTDSCGEHSELMLARMQQLASAFATTYVTAKTYNLPRQ